MDACWKLCADFAIVSKVGTNFSITYVGACQSKETEGLRRLALKWMNHYPGYPAIDKFVHDSNNHAHYLQTELQWNLAEFVDPGHA
jgi:hypothetical protein